MKPLKYFIYLILALIVLFVALGFIKPIVKYGHEIEVNKTVSEAWAVHQDESKLNQWLKGFKSIELLSGEEGEPGSTYKVVVNPGEGQEDFEMTETLISIEEFNHIDMSFDSKMMEFRQKTSFEEKDGMTSVKTESEVKGKGIMMRSMFALMELLGGSFQKQEEENIENLKKVIEENTTEYYAKPSGTEEVDTMTEQNEN